MSKEQGLSLFKPHERVLFALVAILLTLLIGGWSLHKSAAASYQQASRSADELTQKLYEHVGVVNSIVGSLSVLHQVASDIGGDELEIFAEDALEATPIVSSIGRFDRVPVGDLEFFVEEMAERGVYRFELKELVADGSMREPGMRSYHDPIVRLVPFSPSLASLVGVDFSSTARLSTALSRSIEARAPALVEQPAGWPGNAGVMLVHATYLGRYVPDSAAERQAQTDGGFFLELDAARLLREVVGETRGLAVGIRFAESANQPALPGTLAAQAHQTDTERFLKAAFPGVSRVFRAGVGASSLLVEVRSPDGLPRAALRTAALRMLLAALAIMVVAVLVHARRVSDRERILSELSLEREREIALTTLEAISDAVITADASGSISYVNPAAESLLALPADNLIGQPVSATLRLEREGNHESAVASAFDLDAALSQCTIQKLPELKLYDNSEQAIQVDSVVSPFCAGEDDDGSGNSGAAIVMRDVSVERELSRELEYRATHDALTGLANRYVFEMRLREMIAASQDDRQQHAICYIDLDQFKLVNDTCGHSAGDKLLSQVATMLNKIVRANDTIARLGGDEFGMLIRDCEEREAESLARRLHDLFQDFYFRDGEQLFAIRASIGFVYINGQYDSLEEVMAAADIACYSAKDRGRNELHIYRPACEETSSRKGEMLLLPKLQNALRSDSFRLFVQPIAKIEADGLTADCHYEVLLRMVEEDGTLVTPFQLIVAAERYDLMRDIDRWVISHAFGLIAEMRDLLGDDVPRFSINLSGQSTVDSELITYIGDKIDQTGVDPQRLCFEITETSAIANMQHATGLLDFLHELGCKLALDDFGSGVSSFGYLKKLPVDVLKIDGQFIRDIETCEVNLEMVRCIQRVADLLQIDTVAEFVENGAIVDQLRELGVDYAQGYHVSKPFAFEELLQRHRGRAAA
jgi:diguanylate cyclase (GGDEF)-like protein